MFPNANSARTFLGVAVAPLDESLRSHLQRQIQDGSGGVVEEAAEGSPAEQAGIRRHDILISYDDQRLYSPEQLVRLVENDKPGRKAKLHIIRSGQSEDIDATLGSHQMAYGSRVRRAYSWPTANQQRNRQDQQGQNDDNNDDDQQNQGQQQRDQGNDQSRQGENQWRSFDAMALSRVDKKHFKAEIRYRDDRGNIETHHFQGTPDEIRQHIDSQKDLPRAERDRLLRALDMANTPDDVEFQEFHLSNQRS